MDYPKRLIEVDLPIARISAHARREKSIRHGHISTLHIWWARRPLAACRAVICAALWPDPADENCPQAFREAAARHIMGFAQRADGDLKLLATSSEEGKARWAELVKTRISSSPTDEAELLTLRAALLDFIADFADWDNSTSQPYLDTSRALTQAAHEALGGEPSTRPLVVDPFAGGGSIPLEALRVGADAFASDLNPVAVLLNKVVLEYIPKYGQRLADEIRKWGQRVQNTAARELERFYPLSSDGSQPIAYVWARTAISEAPEQDDVPIEVPLLRSMWLAKSSSSDRALRWIRDKTGHVKTKVVEVTYSDGKSRRVRRPLLEVFTPVQASDVESGTVARGSATCPVTGFTTPLASVRKQLKTRQGGAADARLLAVREVSLAIGKLTYRPPTSEDERAILAATQELADRKKRYKGAFTLLPDEPTPAGGGRGAGRAFSQRNYGMDVFSDLFTPRQLLALSTISRVVQEVAIEIQRDADPSFAAAVHTLLATALGRLTDFSSSLCVLKAMGNRGVVHTFGRQAIPIVWDFAETSPLNPTSASWMNMIDYLEKLILPQCVLSHVGHSQLASATRHPLPNDIVSAFVTDPPYYDAVPYADLSDYFYVWLKRTLPGETGFTGMLTPKDDECIVDEVKGKDKAYFERTMGCAMAEGRRILLPSGIGIVVFAHKSTGGWEAQLQAMIDAGWVVTGSWPIDTEQPTRLRARTSAALASSVHIVCRPRENPDGTIQEDIGEWRDVLTELPVRIHEWMPRLAQEGVVGADAIFACLGPALEVFSRYSRVEKASGEAATLREYLEHVWAAVSTEALSLIFEDADAAGLEPDARLTAMWLWTLGGGSGKAGANGNGDKAEGEGEEGESDEDEDEGGSKGAKVAGYVLEFDAARKIAQGLGIHLEKSESIVEVKGDKARLLPVSERTQHLFGKDTEAAPTGRGKKKAKQKQKSFFEELDEAQAAEAGWGELKGPPPGSTVLDRLHQAMILFAAGRGELLKRFLIEEGVGTDARFWKLAQSLSALYPRGSDEKRWVDGVLARKKGLGF